jgi:hypothetical protein
LSTPSMTSHNCRRQAAWPWRWFGVRLRRARRRLDGIDLIDGIDVIDLRTLLMRLTSLGRDANDVKRLCQQRQRCQFCPLSMPSILSTPSMTSHNCRRQAAWPWLWFGVRLRRARRRLDGIDLIDGIDVIDLRTLLMRLTSLGRDVNTKV